MKQPISTVTNAGFIIAGAIWFEVYWLAALSLVMLGLASGWYHWKKHRMAQSADIIAIFLTFNSLIAYFLSMGFGVPDWMLVPSVVIITLVMAIYERDISSMYVVPAQFFVMVLISIPFISQWYIFFFVGMVLANIPERGIDKLYLSHWLKDCLHGVGHLSAVTGFYMIL